MKTKKITQKQFKEIFDKAYGEGSFKFFGYEYILLKISILDDIQAKEYQEKGLLNIAKESRNRSDDIYEELKKLRYLSD